MTSGPSDGPDSSGGGAGPPGSSAARHLEELAGELCRVFLGWKLGGDHEALLALGEGALTIDLRSAECSCDGDPIPPLFIAGELGEVLLRGLERGGVARESLSEGRLEALFEKRHARRQGREIATLGLACRVRLATAAASAEAEANNASPLDPREA